MINIKDELIEKKYIRNIIWDKYLFVRPAMTIRIEETLDDGTDVYGWKSEPPETPFAEDYAHYLTDKKIFSEEECKEWNDYLLEQEIILKKKFSPGLRGDGRTGVGPEHVTSRYQYFNLLKFDFHLVERLKTEILEGMKTILSVSGNSDWKEPLYAKSWFNVLRGGEGMQLHSHSHHSRTLYGFHVSINAKETATSYFHPSVLQVGPNGIDFLDAFHNQNRIGYLTLFPNNICHGVSPNQQETPRISIAGDVTPFLGEDSLEKAIKIGIL